MIMLCLLFSILGMPYEKCRGYLLRSWGATCCAILGIQVETEGEPPKPPFLLVSNHLSYLDIFVLFSQLRCLFVAKSDVKSWPLMGFIIRTCGILFIDRNRKRDVKRVNKLISRNINTNQGIILFPEGTTSPGMHVLPFRSSLLEYPSSQAFAVSYAALSYSTPDHEKPAYERICWWDDTPFFQHFMHFLRLKKCRAKVHFGNHRIMETDRKVLASRLEEAIEEVFEPVVKENRFLNEHGKFEPLAL